MKSSRGAAALTGKNCKCTLFYMAKLFKLVIPANLQFFCGVSHFQASSRENSCIFAAFELDEDDISVKSCTFAGFYDS
jgi:hypothetical protein